MIGCGKLVADCELRDHYALLLPTKLVFFYRLQARNNTSCDDST